MLSPFMTVVVLAVLWLIVVVPMVLRRSDERRRERSVEGFGRAMRALGRRADTVDEQRSEVYVPRQNRAQLAAPARRPVPAAQEALMYPPDRSDLSAARAQMLARRRRSLGILLGGSVIFTLAALVMGGAMWLLDAPFLVGFLGYTWFLRSQALRNRTRRENRQNRAAARRPVGYDATEEIGRFEQAPESVVRIDDDDVELMSMDTIDLTGLYHEDLAAPAAGQRRAS
jgi:membrane protein implicated in regulation of membrane protease activity